MEVKSAEIITNCGYAANVVFGEIKNQFCPKNHTAWITKTQVIHITTITTITTHLNKIK